jgi:hypothetical protein
MKKHEHHTVSSEIETVFNNRYLPNQIDTDVIDTPGNRPVNDWTLLEAVQSRHHPIKRIRQCNTKVIPKRDSVTIVSKRIKSSKGIEIRGSFGGTIKCKSKTCLCCSNNVTRKQTDIVDSCVDKALKGGIEILFVTLTQKRSNDLDMLWNLQDDCFKEFRRSFGRKMKKIGVKWSYVSNKDITFSKDRRKGVYNLHLHLLVFIKKPLNSVAGLQFITSVKDTKDKFKAIVGGLWTSIVNKKGHYANQQGQDVQVVSKDTSSEELSSYIVKISKTNSRIAYEVSRNSTKNAKAKNNFGLFELAKKIYASRGQDRSLIRIYKEFCDYANTRKLFARSNKIDTWFEENCIIGDSDLNVNNDDIVDSEEEDEVITLEISKVGFTALSIFKIKGVTIDVLGGSWIGEFDLSRQKLIELCEVSMSVKDYNTTPKQLQEIHYYLKEYVNALHCDKLITNTHYNSIVGSLSKSR